MHSIKLKCVKALSKKVSSLGFFGFVDDDYAAADQQQGNKYGNGARASALAEQQRAQQHAKDRVHKPKDRDAADGVDGKQARPQRVGDRGDKRHVDDERDGRDDRSRVERTAHQKADGGEDQAAD